MRNEGKKKKKTILEIRNEERELKVTQRMIKKGDNTKATAKEVG